MCQKIPVIIHNRSTYDDHFIIKQLPEEFQGQFKCLGENTEKYVTYLASIKREVANDDDDYDDDDYYYGEKKKTAGHRLSFIDSCRLMPGKSSDLVDNLSGIFNVNCKKYAERKNTKSECYYRGYGNDRLYYKCKECEKNTH